MIRLWSLIIILTAFQTYNCDNAGYDQTISDLGDYTFLVNNKTWLQSAPVFLRLNNETVTLDNSSLVVDSVNRNCTNKHDDFGQYDCTSFRLRASGDYLFDIYFKEYAYPSKFYIYELVYVNATPGTQAPDCHPPPWPPVPGFETCYNSTVGAFPSFQVVQPNGSPPLGYMTFADKMMGDVGKNFGAWGASTPKIADGMLSGPVAIFDQTGTTLLLSSADNFMTSSVWHQDSPGGRVNWGVMGGVNLIPAGYSVRTILVPAEGVNTAFETWGLILRSCHQHDGTRQRIYAADTTISHLGYWTDNGAFYYYNTEDADVGRNITYEQTLTDVKTYSSMHKIPYKYLQIDSWWYYKGLLDGIKQWSYRPEIFPRGVKFLSQTTGWSIAAHNRYWSSDNVYDKANGGNYTFIKETLLAIPDDQTFWNDLLSTARQWGLIMYEQDWLNIQTIGTVALQTDLTLGERWLQQMNNAAQKLNITIQYCMALPRHALQSLKNPAVTQARVSDDYHLVDDQWKIGISSIFADAMGLAPYKDTFWTSETQSGNSRYPDITEPYPALQSLVSTLSKGPVGPGDKLNATNREVLLRCCNDEGLILKPSRPAKAIDRQLIKRAFPGVDGPVGEVWTTYSKIKQQNQSPYTYFGILFAANMTSDYLIYPNQTGFPSELSSGVVFSYTDVYNYSKFDNNNPLHLKGCTDENFCLYYFSTVFFMNGTTIGVLGEINKWVPMSPQRVNLVVRGETTVDVVVTGVPYEELEMSFLIKNQVKNYVCQLGPSGQATFSTSLGGCTNYVSSTHHPLTSRNPNGNKGTSIKSSLNILFTSIVLIASALFLH
ncbi:uncharacterized protein LOC110464957 [Mizuhopecten yessoensis]|uniref:Uncharacterized protein n=2 Tax=Mizuhopecten yessoensis TaxID=6573 RepID=A0A210PSQ9_MIZYE|nr:uncharacterized protein LOC110464957 [Mizuhopecten yessoensis]OWF39492.1 hypothetical protein KP79_PYT03704 [Mizuhopecten yessoensis]